MKSHLLFFCFLVLSNFLFAQNAGCDGSRYINDVFDDFKVTFDVQYGTALGLSGNSKNLFMDIYEPMNDTLEERPVVILAHGGSFIGGDRSEFAVVCELLARKGYVAATMNYRLIDALVFDSTQISEIVVMATLDMKAAIRLFRDDAINANTYKVDPSLIIVGGASAGGITSSHAAFLDSMDVIPSYMMDHIIDNGGYEGNSSATTYLSSEVQGLLNYSGSLGRVHWINEDDIPFYSAHDEFDPVVPCDYDATNVVPFPVFTYGSCSMKERADAIGLENELYLVEGSSGHVSYFVDGDTVVAGAVLEQSIAYMVEIICGPTTNIAPLIMDDEVSVVTNTPTNIDVSENDSDTDGALNLGRLRIQSPPSNGSAMVNENGDITYTSDSSYLGSDSLVYLLCDDGSPFLCNKATVNISVGQLTHSSVSVLNENAFQVYPNPATDKLYIKTNGNIQNYSIEIYSLTGQLVYNQIANQKSLIEISTKQLNSGSYVLKMVDIEKNVSRFKKVVVM